MPRHQPKVAAEVPAESAEPALVKRAARKPKAVAAEPVAAEPAEAAPARAPRARKPPTEAQLANRKRFAEQQVRIKQLRAADPKLTQREAWAKTK